MNSPIDPGLTFNLAHYFDSPTDLARLRDRAYELRHAQRIEPDTYTNLIYQRFDRLIGDTRHKSEQLRDDINKEIKRLSEEAL
jgi:hypothetical protein